MLLLQLLPLYVIIFAANLSPAARGWRWVALGLIGAMNFLILLAGLSFLVAGPGAVATIMALESAAPALSATGVRVAGILFMLTAVAASLLLRRDWRAALIGRLRLDLDSENMVHLAALVFTAWLLGLTLGQLFLLMGASPEMVVGGTTLTLAMLWEQGVAFTLFALLGVGLGLRRSLGEALARLGVALPTARQVGIALAAILILTMWDALLSLAWQAGAPESFERISAISEILFAGVVGPLGALTIGLSAGIGEELLFRGAIQPRFGLVLATLLFTVGHTQYEISPALLSVFIIGLVLGLVRQRENTIIAILIHAGYNALSVLLASL